MPHVCSASYLNVRIYLIHTSKYENMSHTACEDELRQNLQSHNAGVYFYFCTRKTKQKGVRNMKILLIHTVIYMCMCSLVSMHVLVRIHNDRVHPLAF